jgi:uncharacterized membrane protein YgcG
MPTGQEFIKHEFDEAIAVQQTIVTGARELARVHPMQPSKAQLQAAGREAEQWLRRLQKTGSSFGATGEKEEVARGIDQLAVTTLQNASSGDPSEVYEAQAVVINALRKQQDAAGSIVKIATSMRNRELAAEGREMQRASKRAADDLAKNLTELAVMIATDGQEPPRQSGSRSRASGSTRSSSASSSRGRKSSTASKSSSASKSGGSSSGRGGSTKKS